MQTVLFAKVYLFPNGLKDIDKRLMFNNHAFGVSGGARGIEDLTQCLLVTGRFRLRSDAWFNDCCIPSSSRRIHAVFAPNAWQTESFDKDCRCASHSTLHCLVLNTRLAPLSFRMPDIQWQVSRTCLEDAQQGNQHPLVSVQV